jgi:hypothetical protein
VKVFHAHQRISRPARELLGIKNHSTRPSSRRDPRDKPPTPSPPQSIAGTTARFSPSFDCGTQVLSAGHGSAPKTYRVRPDNLAERRSGAGGISRASKSRGENLESPRRSPPASASNTSMMCGGHLEFLRISFDAQGLSQMFVDRSASRQGTGRGSSSRTSAGNRLQSWSARASYCLPGCHPGTMVMGGRSALRRT